MASNSNSLDEKRKQIEKFYDDNNYNVDAINELGEKTVNILYNLIKNNVLNENEFNINDLSGLECFCFAAYYYIKNNYTEMKKFFDLGIKKGDDDCRMCLDEYYFEKLDYDEKSVNLSTFKNEDEVIDCLIFYYDTRNDNNDNKMWNFIYKSTMTSTKDNLEYGEILFEDIVYNQRFIKHLLSIDENFKLPSVLKLLKETLYRLPH